MSAVTYHVAPSAPVALRRPGFFARLLAAAIESRMRKADEEIKRHTHMLPRELEQAGWKLTERSEDSLPFAR